MPGTWPESYWRQAMIVKPDFLFVGALVCVSGLVGMIAEIAESQNSILVKVESAKAAQRFQEPNDS
ncbi:MAG: hypothetical protein ACOYYS_17820 [Chloroflexota bacterium]